MFLSIDPHNGLAIYDQIVRQVKFTVACGGLRKGELVPSVRELARELAINPNSLNPPKPPAGTAQPGAPNAPPAPLQAPTPTVHNPFLGQDAAQPAPAQPAPVPAPAK